MFFKSFFLFVFAISTAITGVVHARTQKVRQPVGERVSSSAHEEARQPVGDRAPQPVRQPVGERATPVQRQQPVDTYMRQPIGSREAPPQRIERPALLPEAAVQIVQRPVVYERPLPQVILMDRHSESYPSAALTPHLVSRKGDFIQLDDGSGWKVRHKDQKRAKKWNQGDVVVIETGQLLTWSIYKLVNYTRNESCDVELVESLRNCMLSHWIAELHPFDGYLRLQDGSVWSMSTSELLKWNVNDDVIVGLSKNWFSGHYSYVLINPRAKMRLLATFHISL